MLDQEAHAGWIRPKGSDIAYRISGDFAQIVEIRPLGGDLLAQTGCMVWMQDATMSVSGGGGVARVFGGGGYFLSRFKAESGQAKIGLAARKPGVIVPYFLDGGTLLCERRSFLAAEEGVEIGGTLQRRIGAGVFGGEGFLLQKLSGRGMAFLSCAGGVTEHSLGPEEALLVDPGHVAFFEGGVDYEVTAVPGVRNFFFSGEGLLLARLTGPGKVWTQAYSGATGGGS
jgi:uncharacterized protein (TIGR00266 family)